MDLQTKSELIIPELDPILAAYMDAARQPGGTRLSDWTGRYPEHAEALLRFAVYDDSVRQGDAAVLDEAGAEQRFAERARMVAARMQAAEAQRGAASAAPLVSLLAAAQSRGLTVPTLAQALGVGPLEVSRLNQRLFRASTLPKLLVERLAAALERTVEDVAAYLRLQPTLAAGVSYKAKAAPRVGNQVDFLQAVAQSGDMSPDQKAFWQEASADLLGEESA